MCAPAILTTFGMTPAAVTTVANAAAIGGTLLGAVGAYQEADAAKQQFDYQAAIARNNQILAQRKAAEERVIGQRQAANQRARGEKLVDRQRIVMASQGGDLGVGSNLDLVADGAVASKLEEEAILFNAERRANAIQSQANTYGMQSQAMRRRASQVNPLLDASIVGAKGFASFASQWYSDNK